MTARKHDVGIETDFITGDHVAHCNCGWESAPQASNDEAFALWYAHLAEVAT